MNIFLKCTLFITHNIISKRQVAMKKWTIEKLSFGKHDPFSPLFAGSLDCASYRYRASHTLLFISEDVCDHVAPPFCDTCIFHERKFQ